MTGDDSAAAPLAIATGVGLSSPFRWLGLLRTSVVLATRVGDL